MMNMLVSASALVLACTVLFAYDWFSFRQGIVENLSIQAQIIGANSISSLLFNDADSAGQTLAALQASPHISTAAIYTPGGQPFAVYRRNAEAGNLILPSIPSGLTQVEAFSGDRVGLTRLIKSEGKVTGIVYIESDLQEINARLRQYMEIVAAVLLVSMLAALMVSLAAKRSISEPIADLAQTAQLVSRERNYSVRAKESGHRGELSALTKAFNEMLGQIQERDAELEKARNELEQRVEERTAQLETANKELEAFSYSVSHDLRAPLRHIDGFSSILAEKFGSTMDPAAQRYLSHVREGAKNMGMLVDDLLKMARIGRQEAVRQRTDLNVLLQDVMRELRSETEGRSIEWRISTLPTVNCDAGLIKVVFTNLLSNAIKYTRNTPSPVIEVNHIMQDGSHLIFVRDNGAGFDQKYAHKLFGVFQRLHRAEDFEGTGVGLATVQRIINKHGGRIWAQGEVDRGATFSFTLSATD
jgi:signal transduction histidine kinase